MREKPHRIGSDTHRERSLHTSIIIHIQENITFGGPQQCHVMDDQRLLEILKVNKGTPTTYFRYYGI